MDHVFLRNILQSLIVLDTYLKYVHYNFSKRENLNVSSSRLIVELFSSVEPGFITNISEIFNNLQKNQELLKLKKKTKNNVTA